MKNHLFHWISLILILMLACGAAAAESSSADAEPEAEPEMTLTEFQAKWNTETDDFYDYYLNLTEARGPFELWTPEEQYRFDQMVEDISESRILRDAFFRKGWIDNTSVVYEIGQWRYALPEEVPVSRQEAIAKAGALLRDTAGLDTGEDDWRIGASLCSGHWYSDPFPTPWWIIHFYRGGVKVTDVWVSASGGDSPLHDTTTVVAMGKLPFLASGIRANGVAATEDLYTSDQVTVFYLEESGNWMILVDSGRDSFWQIEINDQTLKFEDLDKSNG